MSKEKEIMGRIENWYEGNPYGYASLDGGTMCIFGEVYDDPRGRFEDGDSIRTSGIVKLDEENNTVETRNSIYTLGKPRGEDND